MDRAREGTPIVGPAVPAEKAKECP